MLRQSKGFTLLELIVTIGIFTLLAGGAAEIIMTAFRSQNAVFDQLAAQNEGRKAVQDFVSEIRIAAYSSIGAYPLEKASDTEIIFYANVDSDALRERIRYFAAGTTLKKGVLKPAGSPLAYVPGNEIITDAAHDLNAATPLFYYYDQNYTGQEPPLADPVNANAARTVGIRLTIEKNPATAPASFTAEAKGTMRNLKSN